MGEFKLFVEEKWVFSSKCYVDGAFLLKILLWDVSRVVW